jgi:hypothetical protein
LTDCLLKLKVGGESDEIILVVLVLDHKVARRKLRGEHILDELLQCAKWHQSEFEKMVKREMLQAPRNFPIRRRKKNALVDGNAAAFGAQRNLDDIHVGNKKLTRCEWSCCFGDLHSTVTKSLLLVELTARRFRVVFAEGSSGSGFFRPQARIEETGTLHRMLREIEHLFVVAPWRF